MKTIVALAIAAGLLFAASGSADTIYGWTDEHGIKRFSHDPPPEGVENFQKFESQASQPQDRSPADERRPSYDRMIRQAEEESRQLQQQREAEAAARKAERERLAEAQRQNKIQAEQRRLEQQIESINKRALGPTYTQGMKKAQIDKIRKQIEALEKNQNSSKPQKQESASESKSGY